MTDGQAAGVTETGKRAARPPWHLWLVGALSLLWSVGGAYDYTMTKTRDAGHLASLTSEQLAWVDSFPLWANTCWALGVWGAVAGSLLLLARSRFAVTAFAISLAGLIGTTIFQYGLGGMPASMKTGGSMAFSAALWAVAGLLLWYATRMRARRVLR